MLINKKHLDLYKPEHSILLEERIYKIFAAYTKEEETGVTVFLSHKHDEKDILTKVIELLRNLGVKVYIDWMDDEMPSSTNGETAEKIKTRIAESRKFILLATDGAISSKWCNWELGYGDAKKYDKHIAIMPIAENDGSWKGNEYLQIYPAIKTDYEIFKGDYFVEFKNDKTKLTDWLKS
jgi:hypothetical protein